MVFLLVDKANTERKHRKTWLSFRSIENCWNLLSDRQINVVRLFDISTCRHIHHHEAVAHVLFGRLNYRVLKQKREKKEKIWFYDWKRYCDDLRWLLQQVDFIDSRLLSVTMWVIFDKCSEEDTAETRIKRRRNNKWIQKMHLISFCWYLLIFGYSLFSFNFFICFSFIPE